MSLLTRYRKSGGFLQILQLIESCGPTKQEKLLGTIESESKAWADCIRLKMLTIEKIFSWSEEIVGEITNELQDLTLAYILTVLNEEQGEKAKKMLSHTRLRLLEDLTATKQPTPGEVNSASMKVITCVRELASKGVLRFNRIDPELIIPDDIEEQLEGKTNGKPQLSLIESETAPSHTESHGDTDDVTNYFSDSRHETEEKSGVHLDFHDKPQAKQIDTVAVQKLMHEVNLLRRENAILKKEVVALKEKLGNIRKLAA